MKKMHSDLTCVIGWEKVQVPGPIPVALRQEQASRASGTNKRVSVGVSDWPEGPVREWVDAYGAQI